MFGPGRFESGKLGVIYEGRARVKGLGPLEPEDGKGGRPGAMPNRCLKTESSNSHGMLMV